MLKPQGAKHFLFNRPKLPRTLNMLMTGSDYL